MLVVLAAVYVAAAALALALRPHYLHMDGAVFLDLAARAGQGDWRALVNGHWSPLWPAVLAASFRPLPQGPAAGHAVAVVLSLALLAQFYILLRAAVRSPLQRAFWTAALGISLLPSAVTWITADLLQANLVALQVVMLYRAFERRSKRMAAAAGLLAAAAYLAKAFGFPWAIALCVTTAAYRYWRERQPGRQLWSLAAIYGAFFLLGSAPWLVALRAEYGVWTTSLSGRFNVQQHLLGRGIEWSDVLADPGPGRRHVWDHPTRRMHSEPLDWQWAPVNRALQRNLRDLGSILWENPAMALAAGCAWGRAGAGFGGLCRWLAVVWTAGYLMVLMEYRYLLPMLPLLFLGGAEGAERLDGGGRRARALCAGLALGVLGVSAWNAARQIQIHLAGRDYDRMVMSAASAIRADGAPGTVAADRMEESLLLAFHAGRVSVNVLRPHPGEAVDRAADQFGIRYLLWKHPSEAQQGELTHWTQLWRWEGAPGRWILFRRDGRRAAAPSAGPAAAPEENPGRSSSRPLPARRAPASAPA